MLESSPSGKHGTLPGLPAMPGIPSAPGIRTEVRVERAVLLHDHDDVLDLLDPRQRGGSLDPPPLVAPTAAPAMSPTAMRPTRKKTLSLLEFFSNESLIVPTPAATRLRLR